MVPLVNGADVAQLGDATPAQQEMTKKASCTTTGFDLDTTVVI